MPEMNETWTTEEIRDLLTMGIEGYDPASETHSIARAGLAALDRVAQAEVERDRLAGQLQQARAQLKDAQSEANDAAKRCLLYGDESCPNILSPKGMIRVLCHKYMEAAQERGKLAERRVGLEADRKRLEFAMNYMMIVLEVNDGTTRIYGTRGAIDEAMNRAGAGEGAAE